MQRPSKTPSFRSSEPLVSPARLARLALLVLSAHGLVGCGESSDSGGVAAASGAGGATGSGGAAGSGGAGGAGGQDLGPCVPSAEPFGTDVTNGESFPDVKLTACDGTSRQFEAIRCENAITLLSIGAGWCAPCQEETPQLEAAAAALVGKSVGIIQVLFEDGQSNPATTLFCDTWVTEFGLTIPVYVDPPGNTLAYFDAAAAPLNVVVDHEGKVLWSAVGVVPDDLEGLLLGLLPP